MEKQIKPCPFCGCIPEIKESCVNFGEYSINGFKVSCECGVETRTKIYDYDGHSEIELKTKVIDIWNKRADGWISVKDRLPKPNTGKTFIVYINEASIQTSWYSQDEDFLTPEFDYTDVTHWMPLPKAPKK